MTFRARVMLARSILNSIRLLDMPHNNEIRGKSEPTPRPSVATILNDVVSCNRKYIFNPNNPWAEKPIEAMEFLAADGVNENTAYQNIDAIEHQNEAAARTFDRQMIMMTHQQALAANGLALQDNFVLEMYVTDGGLFCSALDQVESDPEFTINLNSYFRKYLSKLSQLSSCDDNKAEVLFDGEIPNWWTEVEDNSTSIEHESVAQILAYTPFLAHKLTQLGGNPKLANTMANVAAFAHDGDLFPWAASDSCQLLQNDDGTYAWGAGEIQRDWKRSLNILKMARPGGAFYNFFKQSLIDTLEIVSITMEGEDKTELHNIQLKLQDMP